MFLGDYHLNNCNNIKDDKMKNQYIEEENYIEELTIHQTIVSGLLSSGLEQIIKYINNHDIKIGEYIDIKLINTKETESGEISKDTITINYSNVNNKYKICHANVTKKVISNDNKIIYTDCSCYNHNNQKIKNCNCKERKK